MWGLDWCSLLISTRSLLIVLRYGRKLFRWPPPTRIAPRSVLIDSHVLLPVAPVADYEQVLRRVGALVEHEIGHETEFRYNASIIVFSK